MDILGIVDDLGYTVKLLRGIWSGYAALQHQCGDEWLNCETKDGIYIVEDDPYYVCTQWRNGSHTPLPIILGWPASFHTRSVQDKVARQLEWIAFRVDAPFLRDFRDAFIECAYYEYENARDE